MSVLNPFDHPIAFSRPLRLVDPYTWVEHIPFGMMLIELLRPRILVELGTHSGNSYCAFCQAASEAGVKGRFSAIDTWKGDAQAGFYGSEVLADLRAHHDPLYGGFSTLVQSTFDDALRSFEDETIEMLHLDGLHTYEAVKHDFEAWLPKLSKRAVVLLHDTHVRDRNFGVWRVWEELSGRYPHFEFLHGFGLGIVRTGEQPIPELEPLFSLTPAETSQVRELFFAVGARLLPDIRSAGDDLPAGPGSERATPTLAGTPADSPTSIGTDRAPERAPTGIKTDPPVISVIIPNYNGGDDLRVCLRSLEELDYPSDRLEVIVVDNASSDSSTAMLDSEFPRIRVLQNEKNLGFSIAANQGGAQAKGDHLAFLNTDMRVDKGWLRALLAPIQAQPDIACVGSLVMNWDGTEIQFAGRHHDLFSLEFGGTSNPLPSKATREETPYAMFASGGAMLIRKAAFDQLSGFDPSFFMYHEDVDLGWRAWLSGFRCCIASESIVYHKGGASSGRLAPSFIEGLQVRNLLATTFRNLEAETLQSVLPTVLFHLLQRTRYWRPAQEALQVSLKVFLQELDGLTQQRAGIQQTRIQSDSQIFSEVGHPFAFLVERPDYSTLHEEITSGCSYRVDERSNPAVFRQAVNEWLNASHFIHERHLRAEIAGLESQVRAGTHQLAQEEESGRALANHLERLDREVEALRDEIKRLITLTNDMSNSLSWRITRPLRAMKGRIERLPWSKRA